MIECIVFSDMTGGTGKASDGEALTTDVLAAHAAAIQEQLCGPFADAWDSATVNCRVGTPGGADVGPNERLMGYWQTPDVAGAAGYHATDPKGHPYGKVFLDDASSMSKGSGAASVIASHEACEMSLDPTANLLALRTDGTFDAYEACDAVEDVTYTASNGVEVSDFLLPAAFDPGSPGPYDKLAALVDQYGTTPGGYRITGTATMGDNGAMRVAFKADGPGLKDPAKLARKQRPYTRAVRRGVSFEEV